jgi:putative tryptophan/tyrosine transport system substrate-binding protein
MNRSKQSHMTRKTIIVVWLVGLALASVHLVEAQQVTKMPKIGWLGARPIAIPSGLKLLAQELRALGYVEGKNITFESRYAEGKYDRLAALADELARLDG